MGATIYYADGSALTSSALTLAQMNALMVPLALAMLGLAANGADPASGLVRVSWPTTGAPFPRVTEDICFLRCIPKDDPYDLIRERMNTPNNGTSIQEQWGYTRAWTIRFTHYGPNSLDYARAVRSAMYQDYFTQLLAQSNLFPVSDFPEIVRVPENIDGQWFERVDLEVEMYEAVTETIVRPTVASVEIIVEEPSGAVADVTAR